MKLVRYGSRGSEKPGVLDTEGRVRDLSGVVADISPEVLAPAQLQRLRGIDPATLPRVDGHPRLGAPIAAPGTFFAIGLNYADHAREIGLPIPSEPVFFIKAAGCINGPDDPIVLPKDSHKADWEVELGIVIGSSARYVDRASALAHVAGYFIVNDVSEREFQKEHGSQWAKGKGCDTFGPIGPWLVTADEVRDPQLLDLWLDVNGERMQAGNTREMVCGVADLVAYLSRFTTLRPGDLITTGTPPGVGESRRPPVFLKPGDVMHLGIAGLGEQRQRVAAWSEIAGGGG